MRDDDYQSQAGGKASLCRRGDIKTAASRIGLPRLSESSTPTPVGLGSDADDP